MIEDIVGFKILSYILYFCVLLIGYCKTSRYNWLVWWGWL